MCVQVVRIWDTLERVLARHELELSKVRMYQCVVPVVSLWIAAPCFEGLGRCLCCLGKDVRRRPARAGWGHAGQCG